LALEDFERDVAPLPIQFKYEGEPVGGFQFVDQQMRTMLDERPDLVSVPDAATLATFEPDGSFMASSSSASQLEVSSTQFTNQDHSFARFPDLMVLDIDRPFEEVLPQFKERSQQHPEELWAIHSTQHGTHAMRLDVPVRPDQADPELMMSVGVDKRYLKLAQQESEWTARVTPKQSRQDDCIQLKEIVGTGEPDPRLLQQATAYQAALVDNGMDAPESVDYLTQYRNRDREVTPVAAEPQGDYQASPAASADQGNPTELKQPDQAQPSADEGYSPSREELRQWCAVAIARGNEPLTAEIIEKGKQLNALYTQETGSSEKPPLDYRSPALVINQRDRQQMQAAIAAGKQTLATAQQPQQPTPQPRQTRRASAEMAY
jgi:hypothetical protein